MSETASLQTASLPERLQMHASRWRSAGEVQLADALDEAREALLATDGETVEEPGLVLSAPTIKWLTQAEDELRRECRFVYADAIAEALAQATS